MTNSSDLRSAFFQDCTIKLADFSFNDFENRVFRLTENRVGCPVEGTFGAFEVFGPNEMYVPQDI